MVALEEMAGANAKEWLRTQYATSALHNSGAYAPAYTKSKAGEVRKHVLALADALVTTLDLFGVPSDADFVNFLYLSAKQMTGGAISAVNGQLNLLEGRKRIHISNRGGINKSITGAMNAAVRAGKLRLNNQRIRFSKKINHAVRSPSPAEDLTQAASDHLRGVLGTKYANWLATNWALLESVVALREPKHLTLEEQDALQVSAHFTLREIRRDCHARIRQMARWLHAAF